MQTIQQGKVTFYLTEETAQWLQSEHLQVQQLCEADFIRQQAESFELKGGRGQAMLFSLRGKSLVLRQYLRGGLWGKLVHDRFFRAGSTAQRALQEFTLLQQMRSLYDLPVPEPVLARQERCGLCGLWYKNTLLTCTISDTCNIAEIIAIRPLSQEELSTLGSVLKKFFSAGVLHTDLNIRNILFDSSGQVFVIDFDKCCLKDGKDGRQCLTEEEKQGMLSRLKRSFVKEQKLRHSHGCSEADWAVLLRHAGF